MREGHAPECTETVCAEGCPAREAMLLSDSELERLAASFNSRTAEEAALFARGAAKFFDEPDAHEDEGLLEKALRLVKGK